MENQNLKKETYIAEDGLLYCAKCHTPCEKVLPHPLEKGKLWRVHLMCRCEREAYEREKAEREKQEFEERVQRNRMICFHEKEMYGWTFANDDGSVPVMEKARAYVEHWEDVRKKKIGLILWGEVGTGKTFIAAAVANALLDQGFRVLMKDFTEISNISAFDADEYVRSLSSYDLLILDDLGAERTSEFAMQNVFNVVNRRWESGKPLIVTTNKTVDELKGVEDLTLKRINDRILAMCTPIYVGGSSKRRVKADENFKNLGVIFGKGGFKHE
ncbi:ATP-binding protein [Agathobacter ruminis]|uniref:ATP-binding protein n=1 Tax=Agathobacter ruminis TaxID=1712665 RepID=A0A2G3E5Z1_9FIRM|nr:ATP-binding protein [Agathobacter ruminis]MDC7301685.1 ATP-binding protein [Agathobacter ruminis]PHU38631.1 ATP-binding protein [Agathobacter ruminis]